VADVKVIPGEPCILQHKLMVCRLRGGKQMKKKKRHVFKSKCKVWKLKDPVLK